MRFLWTPLVIFVLALILMFGVACGKRNDVSAPSLQNNFNEPA